MDYKKNKIEDFKTAISSTVRSLSNLDKIEVFFGNQISFSKHRFCKNRGFFRRQIVVFKGSRFPISAKK